MNADLISGTSALVPVSVAPLFDRWLRFVDAAEKTEETYTRNIRQFARFLSETGETRPTRETVLAYRDALNAAGKKPATIQGYMTAVKLFFQWTETEGLYPNVAAHVKGAKLDTAHKKGWLNADQVKRLLSVPDRSTLTGARDYALLSLMVTTGLRDVSVAAANVGDIKETEAGTVLYYLCKGHEEKATYVKIADPVRQALAAYFSMRGDLDAASPLFASVANRNEGGRMTERSVSRIVKNHLIAAGFNSDRLTAHSLRHTAATLNLLNGGTPEETQQMLNHKSIVTTQIYVHALERAKNQSENRIAAALFG
jgi:integrase/recombinase XerC